MDTNNKVQNKNRTEDVKSRYGTNFSCFGLKENLYRGIVARDYHEPTPVQEEAIPYLLDGRDALIKSKNGTGKTATYLIPMLNNIELDIEGVQGIVLLPTRELAIQTFQLAQDLSQFMDIKIGTFIGGSPVKNDVEFIQNQKPKVAIGTLGRLIHLVKANHLDFSSVKFFVIDEADDVIQVETTYRITELMKKTVKVQFILVSATFPNSIQKIQNNFMQDPVQINLAEELTLIGITQYHVYLKEHEKLIAMKTLIQQLRINQCIIFCNSIDRVKMLVAALTKMNLPVDCIHSKMTAEERTNKFKSFRNHEFRYLVSSDLCNRGIDNQAVNVVVNFDFPRGTCAYLHRIGRSGRYGNFAVAVSFVTKQDLRRLEGVQKNLNIQVAPMPECVPLNLYFS